MKHRATNGSKYLAFSDRMNRQASNRLQHDRCRRNFCPMFYSFGSKKKKLDSDVTLISELWTRWHQV